MSEREELEHIFGAEFKASKIMATLMASAVFSWLSKRDAAASSAATTLHTFTSAQLDQIRADAWDEGFDASDGIGDLIKFNAGRPVDPPVNPYRKGTDHE